MSHWNSQSICWQTEHTHTHPIGSIAPIQRREPLRMSPFVFAMRISDASFNGSDFHLVRIASGSSNHFSNNFVVEHTRTHTNDISALHIECCAFEWAFAAVSPPTRLMSFNFLICPTPRNSCVTSHDVAQVVNARRKKVLKFQSSHSHSCGCEFRLNFVIYVHQLTAATMADTRRFDEIYPISLLRSKATRTNERKNKEGTI